MELDFMFFWGSEAIRKLTHSVNLGILPAFCRRSL